ncbi:uncharacterized protein LOC124932711 [Impatiens glandulifera]|uniref:uncharacterized protein LOC124932711 n=1 Tax=Impatiens glandulifera TaxID=253017 RepID=UPI001FB115D9|nr:uncharacterized protein LOC124932711 [Impatiens glandulifera]
MASHRKEPTTYVYKLAAAAGSPQLPPAMAQPEVVKRTILSRSYWGLSKQSKLTNRKRDDDHVDVEADVDRLESGKKEIIISKGRRSDVVVRVPDEMRKPAAETRRRSVSHVEVMASAAAVATGLRVKVLVTDMPGFMQVHAFRCARKCYDSLESFSSKIMAHTIKKEFDKVYGAAWHCIVGSSFGSFVTHSTGCFLYFSMENLYLLIFRTKAQINSSS